MSELEIYKGMVKKMKDKDINYKKIFLNNIKILEHYEVRKQIPIWIEEMSELTKCLCKWARNYDKWEGDIESELAKDMTDEISDVTICLDQLKYALHFMEDDLMQIYDKKVQRQLKRIEDEDEK